LIDVAANSLSSLTLAAEGASPSPSQIGEGSWWALLIPALPALSCVLCGIYWLLGVRSKLPAWTTIASLGVAFVLTAFLYGEIAAPGATAIVNGFDWINIAFTGAGGQPMELSANFNLYLDSLTILWMLFVTGLGAIIALYASEYMSHDVGRGYCRFFFAFSLFVLAMSLLVMGDSLVLLFMGWEGVGLCSYLLIGYFFTKPSAVAASKKAFIMNRIGDLGLLLAMMFAFTHFGTLEYRELFARIGELTASGGEVPATVRAIPYLVMVGAFGKSAQLPLYTWLPDAMEGPTPVSALIHAATMVTAGVYLIARLYPAFTLAPGSLEIVAWIGGLTALLAATIGMAQFDIKRIMAYSTVSQLGYMFLGLGVLTTAGAAFHVFTHAFFKATLFLCCGAVMHGFAGQLDLRRLSGVGWMKGWGITGIAMLIGCLNLAGFPLTAGYFSKDTILAEAFVTPGYALLGWIALITAGLTAYYTFRVFFRVFVGPKRFEPGEELHGDAEAAAIEREELEEAPTDREHFHPHAPGWAINTALATLAIGSVVVAGFYFVGDHGWVDGILKNSTAAYESPYGAHGEGQALAGPGAQVALAAEGGVAEGGEAGTIFGFDPHKAMYYISAVVGLIGIGAAWWLHLAGRTEASTSRADALKQRVGWIGRAAERKWYVDEIYNAIFRAPLLILSNVFYLIDALIIDQGVVDSLARAPRAIARGLRPSQNGALQGYATGMAGGVALVLILVWIVWVWL